MNSSATAVTASLTSGTHPLNLPPDPLLAREEPDGEQAEDEAADVREIRDAAALTAAVAEPEVAEQGLLNEPEAEDQDRRQLDDGEEEDDEDDRDHPGAREQQQVAAQHAGDRARGADVRHVRARIDHGLQRGRGDARREVEDD